MDRMTVHLDHVLHEVETSWEQRRAARLRKQQVKLGSGMSQTRALTMLCPPAGFHDAVPPRCVRRRDALVRRENAPPKSLDLGNLASPLLEFIYMGI